MALTKNDIVEKLWQQLDCARKEAFEITESLIETIKSSLESGEDVLVSGFGKFCVKEKGERKGRNPATGTRELANHIAHVSDYCRVASCERLRNMPRAYEVLSNHRPVVIDFLDKDID